MLSQKENPCRKGPKVGGGGSKVLGTHISVGGGKNDQKCVSGGLKAALIDSILHSKQL